METALAEYLSHAPVFIRRLCGEIVYWTRGAEELYGFTAEQAMGRSSHELLQTDFPRPLAEMNSELNRKGWWEGLLSHRRSDGRRLWTESRWRLRRDAEGHALFVVETNTDVTEREHLTRELNHRVKNLLSVVQGLAHLTLRSEEPDRVERFEARLIALASANDLLIQHHWSGAGLKEVIRQALEPFGDAWRIELDGEDVELEPRSVVAYRLAFHELATNALKYGALSVPEGRVRVSWSLLGEQQDKVYLVWRESGAPLPAAGPGREGAGTDLLFRVVSAELGVQVQVRFEPGGLVCEFDGPTQKSPSFAGPV